MSDNQARAFDFEYFETGFSAAPQRKNEEKAAPGIKKVAPRTKEDLRKQEIQGLKKSLRVFAVVMTLFMIISMQIVAGAKSYSLDRQIQEVEALLAVEEAENIRLSSTLNGITGIAVIDTYATEILGMTKVENYQIQCIDLSVGDTVLYTSSLFKGQNK